MADEEDNLEEQIDEEDFLDEEEPKKGKKNALFAILIVLVLAGVGAGLHFSGVLGGGEEKKMDDELKKEDEVKKEPPKTVYYELPEFLINLNSSAPGRVSFLKISVTLELRDQQAATVVDTHKPKIMDAFNTYLRELRPSDLSGSAGIYRLREELMTRLNNTIEPDLVKDVLFSEILVQ